MSRLVLFFDTETTGLPDFNSPPEADHQPRLVQLGCILSPIEHYDPRAEVNLLVSPDGFTIPEQATAIHGIDNEMAMDSGMDLRTAVMIFHELACKSNIVVAHNIQSDNFVMRGECSRMKLSNPADAEYNDLQCTMLQSMPILRIPGRYGKYKWPSLKEAYFHFFRSPLLREHDAMADVRACALIWYEMRRRNEQRAADLVYAQEKNKTN